MASSFFALLDDIASVLDDVAVLTKVAAKKTSGVLGDDLALNAQQVTGVKAERELPVVWAVAKGSAVNKLILVPIALLTSALAPKLITPLLMVGGAFLCFEGCEKIFHKFFHRQEIPEERHREHLQNLNLSDEDLLKLENEKIKGAIRTDFILSAEIIAITLGAAAESPWAVQFGVLIGTSFLMTIGVYGLVAGIVKVDDFGLYLIQRNPDARSGLGRIVGTWILRAAPMLMKALSIAGTIAMFLVGGGIFAHGIPSVQSAFHEVSHNAGMSSSLVETVLNGVFGLVVGTLVLLSVKVAQRAWEKYKSDPS